MDEFAVPNYAGLSIQNLANTLLSHFGAVPRGPKLRLDLDLNNHVVLILIDGLSYQDLVNTMGDSLPVSRLYRITTVFPTTTSTVLTTLFTGLSPGQHGVLGPNLYVKELGAIINTLSMGPIIGERDGLHKMGYDLKKFFPVKSTIFEELSNMGIRSRVYVPKGLSGGLSRITYTGAEIVEYATPYDAIINASKFLNEYETSFVHIYITTVDSASHKYGPNSEECGAVIRETVDSVIKMAKKYMVNFTVLITADHGHDEIKNNIKANDIQGLMKLLDTPPYGDARAIYLRLNDGSNTNELITLLNKYNINGHFLSKDEAMSMGLFGEVSSDIADRISDVIFIPNSGSAFIYLYRPDNEELLTFRGQHGGLTERELYIPLIQL
ncbi:type I phosphodiesterase/nucleotide pyrophosphatase [Vulcanisaeta moutnovskia 768-28]|uniref:Type I phosphodiesterase/nucleotide pyrophosphatase n=1 Tax=Vulcanisaeta moutnovskia (strain 768-28) TaxID=985053 RepID=F0QVI6_VULM7|nr:alkaline phosphatase family protein [Vulcanisaeta moutnovskia]ADY00839.1 type I phosphodiesterase/nucleotide pyrophosphatase [Vulcanisaeta moutnovskia 768-28]